MGEQYVEHRVVLSGVVPGMNVIILWKINPGLLQDSGIRGGMLQRIFTSHARADWQNCRY